MRSMDETERAKEMVLQLLEVVAMKRPLEEADALLSGEVVCHMDGRIMSRTKSAWFRWVRYLHHNASKRVSNLEMEITGVSATGDVVTVDAVWKGKVRGEMKISKPGRVVYTVKGERIVDIKTHRANYVFIYGPKIATPLGFWWCVGKMMLWKG